MSGQTARTRWGGLADGRFRPSGRFRVEQDRGIFWLVDPDGGRFLSKGVNTVRFDQDQIRDSTRVPYAEACQRKYGSETAWRAAAAKRLAGWGFNTLGAWSDVAVAHAGSVLAVAPVLDLGMSFAWRKNERKTSGPDHDFPDVFDPDFERYVTAGALALCGPCRDDHHIIGWFIDNELRWGSDWRGTDELLTLFLNLSAGSPGRIAAAAWLRQRYRSFDAFNLVWRTAARGWDDLNVLPRLTPPYVRKPPYERNARDEEKINRIDLRRASFAVDCDGFAALIAERYFAFSVAAIKAADASHLVLGSRFAYPPPAAIIEAAARHVDVVSFNCYGLDAEGALATYEATGKPCLIGEFSFRAADSGLPNTNGAGPMVADQAERAAGFRNYVTKALRHPTLVGYHWFEHADQPAEGRFDGENSNFGVVTIDDRIYDELTRAMTEVNASAENLHAAALTQT